MKTLIVLAALLSTSACAALAPATVAGIGAATALSIEANYPAVDKKAEKIFKAE